MYKIVVLNCVNYDGMGDFFHFVDIYNALKNHPKMKQYEFIPVIACDEEWQAKRIKQQLNTMDISHAYMALTKKFEETFSEDKHFLNDLKEAKQFILISYWHFPAIEKWRKMNPAIPFKFIGEHEIDYGIKENCARSLGLSPDHYGIKLTKGQRCKPAEATLCIEKESKAFSASLLKQTESKDFNDFHQNHLLIPAYFNNMNHFGRFLRLLSQNTSLSEDKHIAIFLSGNGLKDCPQSFLEHCRKHPTIPGRSDFSYNFNFAALGEESNIKQIVLSEAEYDTPVIFPSNPKKEKTLFIFYGFNLSQTAYYALYQQALLAGVSGDNSFELAAGLTLPYYISTNEANKWPTLRALNTIIGKLNLPEKVKSDFSSYFSLLTSERVPTGKEAKTTEEINLKALSEAWPTVADHLLKHHNFYDRLEKIFFESSATPKKSNFYQYASRFFKKENAYKVTVAAAAAGVAAFTTYCLMEKR